MTIIARPSILFDFKSFFIDFDLDGLKNRAHTTNFKMKYNDLSVQPTYFSLVFSVS